MRCVCLNILFAAWQVVAVDEDEVSGSWNGLRNTPPLSPDSAFAISVRGAHCQCVTNPHNLVWSCGGYNLSTVPANLTFTSDPMDLVLVNAGIEILRDDSLTPYAGILKDLYLVNVLEFHTFETNIFRNTTKLETMHVFNYDMI